MPELFPKIHYLKRNGKDRQPQGFCDGGIAAYQRLNLIDSRHRPEGAVNDILPLKSMLQVRQGRTQKSQFLLQIPLEIAGNRFNFNKLVLFY